LHASELVSFLVKIRTYQHPGYMFRCRPRFLAPVSQNAITYTMRRMNFLLNLVFNCVVKEKSGPKREAERKRK
jgi:hypothetical protein